MRQPARHTVVDDRAEAGVARREVAGAEVDTAAVQGARGGPPAGHPAALQDLHRDAGVVQRAGAGDAGDACSHDGDAHGLHGVSMGGCGSARTRGRRGTRRDALQSGRERAHRHQETAAHAREDAVVTTLVLPHCGTSAGLARGALERELGQQGVPGPVVDDALLVVSELVGNAVRHGAPLPGGGIRVSWWVVGDAVHVEVGDGGTGLPGDAGELRLGARSRHGAGALLPVGSEGGRGLPIIDLLTTRWGTTTRSPGGGVGVYAELPITAAAPASLSRGGSGSSDVAAVAPVWPRQERRSQRTVWPQHLERRASA